VSGAFRRSVRGGPDSRGPRVDQQPPAVAIEMVVDVSAAADGSWSVVLTPAIAALRPKCRTGLVSLPAVRAEVARMLEALAMGGFPVSCTWTLNGDPAAWRAVAGPPGWEGAAAAAGDAARVDTRRGGESDGD